MKSRRAHILIAGTTIIVASFLLYLLTKSDTTSIKANSIQFGISAFPDTYMPYLGKIKGWYQEEGVEVEFKILGWTEIQPALSTNSDSGIDLGINNISSVIATHHKNPEIIYYYGFNTFDNGFSLMARPNGSIKPLEFFLSQSDSREEAIQKTGSQLRNKTIVTTANTDMEQGVAAVAAKGFLKFSEDLTIIDLDPENGLAAFISGTGDAYIGGIPQRNKADRLGMISVITGTDLGPAPINGIVTTKKFASTNQENLLKILKVWFRIVQYTNDNLDEVASIMVSELNSKTGSSITEEDFKKFWDNYEHYPANLDEINQNILSPQGNNYWKSRWDDCNNYFFRIKNSIPNPVDSDSAFYMIDVQNKLISLLGK